MKKNISLFLILVALMLFSETLSVRERIALSSMCFDKSSISLLIGQTFSPEITYFPDNAIGKGRSDHIPNFFEKNTKYTVTVEEGQHQTTKRQAVPNSASAS